ncbi:uncharacterized protein LOC106095235 [Stomoxys calcitrans]|uniref:uncharacterized protein LOC106095235 n=1 Tax=Stomoxys calcitrans TaxID=35570 RepID=UPI0027E25DC2|nr:uncharacterized protein LOC106095235 [Stomoxys calcitrans]
MKNMKGSISILIITLCGLANSETTDENGCKVINQVSEDVGYLKKDINTANNFVELLDIYTERQTVVLLELQQTKSNDVVCEQLSLHINDTLLQCNDFEDSILAKLKVIHEEQDHSLNKMAEIKEKIMNFPQAYLQQVMEKMLAEITVKIANLENQLTDLEHFDQRQAALIKDPLKILEDINKKLQQGQDKFKHLEKILLSAHNLANLLKELSG